MMKKKISTILTVTLFIFSFYYTDKCINILRNKDPIMKKIISKKSEYEILPIESIITKNTIIPGINGISINQIKSFNKMKKLGTYNEALLVYEEINPKVSYKDYYDKIIISNNKKNQLSLVFKIKDFETYKKINTILDKYNILGNYYFQNSFLSNNIELIKEINEPILVNNLINISKYKDIIDYCIIYEISDRIPCQDNYKYTLLSGMNIDNYHLTYTKSNYRNNNILTYTFNNKNVNDLDLIINYLLNNNVKILTIDELLK